MKTTALVRRFSLATALYFVGSIASAGSFFSTQAHQAKTNVQQEDPTRCLSLSYRMVPNSGLTEVSVVNDSRVKAVSGKVSLTKSYTISIPDRTETVTVDLEPGEKVIMFVINQHYVSVRMDVLSAAYRK